MTIDETMNYFNYCVKNGCLDESDLIELTKNKNNEELIKIAEKMDSIAQNNFDSWKENYEN